jgi:dTDP-4-dehydrorhamnose reductase
MVFLFFHFTRIQSKKKKFLKKDKLKPISYYGSTKILSENYIIKKFKNTKVKYCIGRIFSTTNKNQKKNYLIPDLKKKLKKKKQYCS